MNPAETVRKRRIAGEAGAALLGSTLLYDGGAIPAQRRKDDLHEIY